MLETLMRLTAVLVVLTFSVSGTAQTPPDKRAEQLFDEGMALYEAGDYVNACPKIEQSLALDYGMAAEFRLAECYEKSGRYARAWEHYDAVRQKARATGQSERERFAAQRADAVAPKVPRLTIEVPDLGAAPPGTQVLLDGKPVPRERWSKPIPVDGGSHQVQVLVPGKPPWSTNVGVPAEGATVTVKVPDFEALAPGTPGAPKPAGVGSPLPAPAPPMSPLPPREAEGDTTLLIAGIVVGAVGVVGLGIGIGLGMGAKSDYDGAAPHCDANNLCNPTGIAAREDARTQGDVATAVFAIGGAALATGVVLTIIAATRDEPAFGVAVSPGGAALHVRW